MSETVHYRGAITKIKIPEGKTVLDVARQILKDKGENKRPSYYDNDIEWLCDSFYRDYFYYTKTETIYKIDNNEYEFDEDIIEAYKKDEDTVLYELRYYNGGASFEECLEQALDKLSV